MIFVKVFFAYFFLFCVVQDVFTQEFPNPVTLSTGQGPIGSLDPLWQVSPWYNSNPPNPIGLTYSQALINNNCAPGSWVNPASLSAPVNNGNWITGNDASCAENTNSGYRYFRLTLDLPGDCNGQSIAGYNNYTLYLSGYVDNSISDVFVNGTSTGISGGNFAPGGQLNITLNGPWVAGLNFVDILVFNIPSTGANPYGLLLVADGSSSSNIDSDNDGISDLNDLCVCEPGNLSNGCSAELTGDQIICSGESTTLTIQTSGSVLWSTGQNTNSITVNPLTTTVYQATVTQLNGSSSIVSATVTVNPTYTTTLSQSLCEGESFIFNGISYDQTGIYPISLQSQTGCDSIVELQISVYPQQADTVVTSICQGSNYLFEGQNYTQTGIYTQNLTSVYGCDSIRTLVLTVNSEFTQIISDTACDSYFWNLTGQSYQNSGAYNTTLTTSNGCDSTVTLQLIIFNTPDAPELFVNQPKCPGDNLELSATNTPFDIQWQGPMNFSSTEYGISFPASIENTGSYSAFLVNNGCSSLPDEVFADIDYMNDLNNVEIPNFITPNEDFLNDDLNLSEFAKSCSEFEFIIFNRWGAIVFQTSNSNISFTGKDSNGNLLTDGVYYYILKLEDGEKNGFIHVMH
jgi:gliding motility-associated-like protein